MSLLPAAALAQVRSATDREWNQPVAPVEILPGFFFVGAAGVSSFLFTAPEGGILLDSGFHETAPLVEASLAKLKIQPQHVKWLITTHSHYDHVGGIAALKKATKARLACTAEDGEVIETGGKTAVNTPDRLFEPCRVDRILRDGESVAVGGMSVTAHLTPGHTRGALTWTTRISGKNVVIVGGGGVNSFVQLANNKTYPGIVDDYRKSFRVLRNLPCDIFLTNHPFTCNFQAKARENNFVDPEGYQAFISNLERAFEAQLREQSRG